MDVKIATKNEITAKITRRADWSLTKLKIKNQAKIVQDWGLNKFKFQRQKNSKFLIINFLDKTKPER